MFFLLLFTLLVTFSQSSCQVLHKFYWYRAVYCEFSDLVVNIHMGMKFGFDKIGLFLWESCRESQSLLWGMWSISSGYSRYNDEHPDSLFNNTQSATCSNTVITNALLVSTNMLQEYLIFFHGKIWCFLLISVMYNQLWCKLGFMF